MTKPRNEDHYDLIVIGSGPAGEAGAVTAALFGKRVAVIEKSPLLGGASANTGTLPSKTLRETALAISGLRARDLYGVDLSIRREATIADLMYHERHVTANARERIRRNLAKDSIDLIRGRARFVDPHTVAVEPTSPAGVGAGTRRLTGDFILIATGSSPIHPDTFPFTDRRVNDSDEILRLERLPKRLAVVGAGVIGSEYACTFAALGVRTTIIDGRDELLSFLDRDLSSALETSMREHLGIEFLWNHTVVRCEPDPDPQGPVRLWFADGSGCEADNVLVAAGRQSNTSELNLSAAGLTPGPKGRIEVDSHFRTAVPHILAAGDVIGFPALAATSMEQARVAVCHAFDAAAFKANIAPLLPTGIYTIPEVSAVGAAEEDLNQQGADFIVGRAAYAGNARGEIIGDRYGFLKLIFDRATMKLLGVHAIGEQASELVHIGLVAILTNSGADLFNTACFNYPTLGDLYKDATYDALARRAGFSSNRQPESREP
ncbi:MAG: NAD(P)(+) transhydrogenase [Isosphaeraceae bacterium]|jgi:NAD(P) transhydrogenase|nr:MAG: NAD(P)(+) transhydrogenase [Isosphaeraceae bacterium]